MTPTGQRYGGVLPTHPATVILLSAAQVDSVRLLVELAPGHAGGSTAAVPRCSTAQIVEATEDTAASIVAAAVEGAPILVVLPDGRSSARLVDALRRAALVDDWRDEPVAALRPEELVLLHALGIGQTAAEAAGRANVSLRTAFRLLSEARHTLGVGSNVEAGQAVVALGLRLPVTTDPSSGLERSGRPSPRTGGLDLG